MTTLLSTKAAADRLAMHPGTVVRLIQAGVLQGVHNGHGGQGRRWKVLSTSVDRYLESLDST